MLALIGMGHNLIVTCITTIFPSVPLLSTTNITGEGKTEYWTLSFPAEQANLVVTTGHLCLFQTSVVADDRGVLLHTGRA